MRILKHTLRGLAENFASYSVFYKITPEYEINVNGKQSFGKQFYKIFSVASALTGVVPVEVTYINMKGSGIRDNRPCGRFKEEREKMSPIERRLPNDLRLPWSEEQLHDKYEKISRQTVNFVSDSGNNTNKTEKNIWKFYIVPKKEILVLLDF